MTPYQQYRQWTAMLARHDERCARCRPPYYRCTEGGDLLDALTSATAACITNGIDPTTAQYMEVTA